MTSHFGAVLLSDLTTARACFNPDFNPCIFQLPATRGLGFRCIHFASHLIRKGMTFIEESPQGCAPDFHKTPACSVWRLSP